MKTKLILIDGHCSVGKSSISKSVSHQVGMEHKSLWLHEECENHPIRSGEFDFGRLDTSDGMRANLDGMLNKWQAFTRMILDSGQIVITEGCLLHQYDRYFIHSIWTDQEITAYYAQVIEMLREADPFIVFLHRPDLRKSLEKAFLARGDWWKTLMLKPDEKHVFFKDHPCSGEQSMFDAIAFEQHQMARFFDTLDCAKIKIDTSAEEWEGYVRQIVTCVGGRYHEQSTVCHDPLQFVGVYQLEGGAEDELWQIGYDEANKCLFSSLFWPYMPMRCKSLNEFELISFPVELNFQLSNGALKFRASGNYDWNYNDKVFIKIS